MQRTSQLDYKSVLESLIRHGSRWLDIGCGTSILPLWLRDSISFQRQLIRRCDIACGCDPVDHRPHCAGLLKFVGDCTTLPYPDNLFTVVTANMVVEHVENPAQFAAEVRRVLTPDGILVLHTPNLHHPLIALASALPQRFVRWFASRSDGRPSSEIFPTFYRMNTRRAIRSLPGFEVIDLQCLPTGPLLHKLPLLGALESLLIQHAHHPLLHDLQADWIAVLRKRSSVSFPVVSDLEQQRRAA